VVCYNGFADLRITSVSYFNGICYISPKSIIFDLSAVLMTSNREFIVKTTAVLVKLEQTSLAACIIGFSSYADLCGSCNNIAVAAMLSIVPPVALAVSVCVVVP
jgi:hypothetical protein